MFKSSFLTIILITGWGMNQITFTSDDMFNEFGQFFRMYGNSGEVSVSGLLGNTGGPQTWDFTEGPTAGIGRTDIVDPNDTEGVAWFPDAEYAEQVIGEGTGGMQSFAYFSNLPGSGRLNFGAYNENLPDVDPQMVYEPPVIDFPDQINFGDSWTGNTQFYTNVTAEGQTVPVMAEISTTYEADAYGTIILPEIGEGECLRVNTLDQVDVYADLFGFGNYMYIATNYIRSYFWLRENQGIATQIVSQQSESAPPDNFSIALAFVRLFESSESGPEGLLGDVNNDGVHNVLDVVITINIILQVVEPSDYESWAADVNQDGDHNVLDIVLIVNIILGEDGTVTAIPDNPESQVLPQSNPDVQYEVYQRSSGLHAVLNDAVHYLNKQLQTHPE